jgi:uncharacterized membrane protein YphA (DoxX/SURF4 family)
VGLLLLRIMSGLALIFSGLNSLRGRPSVGPAILDVLMTCIGLLLLAGLWTPVAGALLAIIAFWHAFTEPANSCNYVVMGTLGAALALLGPGGWSVDARLFGWKRIEIRDRQN